MLFGKNQQDDGDLFGGKKDAVELTGNPWKVTPYDAHLPGLFELKKPLTEYRVSMPLKGLKVKEGVLFYVQVSAKTAGSEAVRKLAVVVDGKGNVRGAQFADAAALQRAIEKVPSYRLCLFELGYPNEKVEKQEAKYLRVASVAPGTKSAYEVQLERKNEFSGKWDGRTLTLNNFGLRAAPNADHPRMHDLLITEPMQKQLEQLMG